MLLALEIKAIINGSHDKSDSSVGSWLNTFSRPDYNKLKIVGMFFVSKILTFYPLSPVSDDCWYIMLFWIESLFCLDQFFKSSYMEREGASDILSSHTLTEILTSREWFGVFYDFKGEFSGLRWFLTTEGPLKMMKTAFYFTLKPLRSRHI